MKTIVTMHYNRPQCTKKCIEYLERCIGIEDYIVLFHVEPCMTEIVDIISKSNLNKKVVINTSLLGLWKNKKKAINNGFNNSDFVIVIEDDVLLSKDALQYFDWARDKFEQDESVVTVTAYNSEKVGINPYEVKKRNWYNSTAWAIWKNRYEKLVNWNGQDKELMSQLFTENKYEVFPVLSRAQNIGFVNGEKSIAKEVLDVVGVNTAYAPIGISRESSDKNVKFVGNKESYLDQLRKITQNSNDKIVIEQIDKCSKFDFNEQLIVNENGEEFVKLDELHYKSRNNELYKERYYLEVWAENFEYDDGEFFIRD